MAAKQLHFKTNVLLKDLVGKDLINDDNIAIVELVKNSVDAGSNEVLIEFRNLNADGETTEDSQIIVADKGSGMSFLDIRDKWLNIAYSEKRQAEQKAGSYLAGNKGIGRFSCDRLGEHLDLLTKKSDGSILHLPIDWTDFEVENKKDLTIQTIPLYVETIVKQKAKSISAQQEFPKHGTILVISKLRSRWSRDRLLELKKSLEKFANPNQLFLRGGLEILLSAPDLIKSDNRKGYNERINGKIQNQVFDKLKFNSTYISADISSANKRLVDVNLWHEGEKVFSLTEKNTSYPLLHDISAVIYFLNPYKKAYFKRQTGVRLIDFGSIFLFVNGFRVSPYGSQGDDWLHIDIRKGQGTRRYLGSRDIVGRIEVAGNEEEFVPVSSREGLKETPAFKQLREGFFIDVLRKLEKFVVDGLNWDSVPRDIAKELRKTEGVKWQGTIEQYSESWERKQQRIVKSLIALIGSSEEKIVKFWFNPALLEGIYEGKTEEVNALLDDIEEYKPDALDTSLRKQLKKFRALLSQKEEDLRSAREEATKQTKKAETYQAQTLFLKQVTSLDVERLLTYHHQIYILADTVANYLAKGIKALKKDDNASSVIDYLQNAALANKKVAAVSQYATKANFRSGTKKETTDLPAFLEQYILNVAPEFVGSGIRLSVDNKVKELFEIVVSRVELSILVDNIISNSKKARAKSLHVEINQTSKNRLQISFVDDGTGISEELPTLDSAFELGITTTGGSGLGLFHAAGVVKDLGGRIVMQPREPRGVEVRVEIVR